MLIEWGRVMALQLTAVPTERLTNMLNMWYKYFVSKQYFTNITCAPLWHLGSKRFVL